MAQNIVIINSIPDLDLFKKSLLESYIFDNSSDLSIDQVLEKVDEKTTNMALVWSFPGYYSLPFFPDPHISHGEDGNKRLKSKYVYFSDNLISLFSRMNEKMRNNEKTLIVDLLSCNLKDGYFKEEVDQIEKDLGINIRYSIDQTGNSVNWVLESDGVDIKEHYFNETINEWNHLLDTAISFDTAFGSGNYTLVGSTYTLTANITISVNTNAAHNDGYVSLPAGTTFDGNYKFITVNNTSGGGGAWDWDGLFVSAATSAGNAVTITNLGISVAGTYALYGGGIVKKEQKFFNITNCYNTGTISGTYAGGICGSYAGFTGGLCNITNCYNTGTLSGSYDLVGGICGAYVAYNGGTCNIDNCYNTGTISATNAGGICGAYVSYSSGTCNIDNCYNTGEISGGSSGGICGLSAIICNINACYNAGAISGQYAGGICGAYAATCNIDNCYNTGAVSGNLVGGICGVGAGNGGTCTIDNCFSIGSIGGSAYGGIIGSSPINVHLRLFLSNTNIQTIGSNITTGFSYCNGKYDGTYTSKIPTSGEFDNISSKVEWQYNATLSQPELSDFYATPWFKVTNNAFRLATTAFNMNLSNLDLTDQPLNDGNLTGANLSNTNLTNANISGTTITGITFTTGQKLQLLKNTNNRDIGAISLATVTGSDLGLSNPYASATFNVLIPSSSILSSGDFDNNNFVITSADDETITVASDSLKSSGNQILYNNVSVTSAILNSWLYSVQSGSIIGIGNGPIITISSDQVSGNTISLNCNSDLSIGTTTAGSINIGKSGTITSISGNFNVNGDTNISNNKYIAMHNTSNGNGALRGSSSSLIGNEIRGIYNTGYDAGQMRIGAGGNYNANWHVYTDYSGYNTGRIYNFAENIQFYTWLNSDNATPTQQAYIDYGGVYATSYGSISDRRDKSDIRDTILGLNFIEKLHPVDYILDVRADYERNIDEQYTELEDVNTIDENGNEIVTKKEVTKNRTITVQDPKDGSKKRKRFHHGLIAQDVKSTMDELGVDFGGYQSHIKNRCKREQLTLSYSEFIAPLIKSIQELSAQTKTSINQITDLKNQITDLNQRITILESDKKKG